MASGLNVYRAKWRVWPRFLLEMLISRAENWILNYSTCFKQIDPPRIVTNSICGVSRYLVPLRAAVGLITQTHKEMKHSEKHQIWAKIVCVNNACEQDNIIAAACSNASCVILNISISSGYVKCFLALAHVTSFIWRWFMVQHSHDRAIFMNFTNHILHFDIYCMRAIATGRKSYISCAR